MTSAVQQCTRPTVNDQSSTERNIRRSIRPSEARSTICSCIVVASMGTRRCCLTRKTIFLLTNPILRPLFCITTIQQYPSTHDNFLLRGLSQRRQISPRTPFLISLIGSFTKIRRKSRRRTVKTMRKRRVEARVPVLCSPLLAVWKV